MPAEARALMRSAAQHGYDVRCTYAYGWTPDKNGDEETLPVMEETGVVLDSGRMQKRKVGEKEKPPVHSIMLVLRHPDDRQIVLAGYWQDGVFDFGMIHHEQAGGWARIESITPLGKAVEKHAPGTAYLF